MSVVGHCLGNAEGPVHVHLGHDDVGDDVAGRGGDRLCSDQDGGQEGDGGGRQQPQTAEPEADRWVHLLLLYEPLGGGGNGTSAQLQRQLTRSESTSTLIVAAYRDLDPGFGAVLDRRECQWRCERVIRSLNPAVVRR